MAPPLINLFPITKLIAWVSGAYASFVVLLALVFNVGGVAAFGGALRGSSVLSFLLFGLAAAGWRYIWRWIPKLNDWIFPDLNGTWIVEIRWNWGGRSGQKAARAYIKQSLVKTSIELVSDESESETLLVIPHKDLHSSRPGLYYVYRNIGVAGSAKKQAPHLGAAILKLDQELILPIKSRHG